MNPEISMTTMTPSLLEDRRTVSKFDPDITIDDTQIHELIRLATLAPSAFHMQNWSFIAVRTDAAKAKLLELAYGQRQVQNAAVTFIVVGTLEAHKTLRQYLQPSVDQGIIPESAQTAWVNMASASHENNPQLQRDEAIRSATFAAMSMLVAVKEMELDAGVVGGFDSDQVQQTFGLKDNEVPVMLVTVGRAAEGNWKQKIRRPISEVLRLC